MNKTVNVAIVGFGLVGQEFVKQLLSINYSKHIFKIIYISNSKISHSSSDWLAIAGSDIKSLLSDAHDPPYLENVNSQIKYLQSSPAPVIFVDMTASDEIANTYCKLIENGKISIVTPNKRAFSGKLELFNSLQNKCLETGSHILYEATVGAGLPILTTLRDLILTGDRIDRIEGVFSGSLSYIFNNWSLTNPEVEKVSFTSAVKMAKEYGYTEPDPREDLNGADVARKLTILGRLIGFPIADANAFPIQSLIPAGLDEIDSVDEFLKKMQGSEFEMDSRREKAKNEGKVIRYIGEIDVRREKVSVGMKTFDKLHPFATLHGSENMIAFHTARYSEAPLVIRGAGAGAAVTAMGILADCIRVAERTN